MTDPTARAEQVLKTPCIHGEATPQKWTPPMAWCDLCLAAAFEAHASEVAAETREDDATFIQSINAADYPIDTSCVNLMANLLRQRTEGA